MKYQSRNPGSYCSTVRTGSSVREGRPSDRGETPHRCEQAITGGEQRTGSEPRKPLFELGRIVATQGALHELAVAEAHRGHGARRTGADAPASDSIAASLIARHVSGDGGELEAEDPAANEQAVAFGARVLSAYRLHTGVLLWIITEADRSVTTMLLPDEY